MRRWLVSAVVALGLPLSAPLAGAAEIYTPVADGTIYPDGTVITNQSVQTGFGAQGVVEFPGLDWSRYSSVSFSLTPYAVPLGSPTVDIYAYSSADGVLTAADYDAGVYVGSLYVGDLGSQQYASILVTPFLGSITAGSLVGFNIRSPNVDQFSSLAANHFGQTSVLVAFPAYVPEPGPLALSALAFALALGRAALRRV
jgi:hypothetical protein